MSRNGHAWNVGADTVVFGPGGPAGAVFISMLRELATARSAEPRIVMGVSIGATFAAIVAMRLPFRVLDQGLHIIEKSLDEDQDVGEDNILEDLLKFDLSRQVMGRILRETLVHTMRTGNMYDPETLTLEGLYNKTNIDLRILVARRNTRESQLLDRFTFGSTLVIDAVLASMSVPGVFPSVRIAGHRYIDGAYANMYTHETLMQMATTNTPPRASALVLALVEQDDDRKIEKETYHETPVLYVEIPSRTPGDDVKMPSAARMQFMRKEGTAAALAIRKFSPSI